MTTKEIDDYAFFEDKLVSANEEIDKLQITVDSQEEELIKQGNLIIQHERQLEMLWVILQEEKTPPKTRVEITLELLSKLR